MSKPNPYSTPEALPANEKFRVGNRLLAVAIICTVLLAADFARSGFGFFGVHLEINGAGAGLFSNCGRLGVELGDGVFRAPVNRFGPFDWAWNYDPNPKYSLIWSINGEWQPGWKWILAPHWIWLLVLWAIVLTYRRITGH